MKKILLSTLIVLALFDTEPLIAQNTNNSKETNICVAVNCGEIGTTICFKNSKKFMAWHFMNELDKIEKPIEGKTLNKDDIASQYPGMEKYCNRLTIINVPKDKYSMLSEEIKQRLSGI